MTYCPAFAVFVSLALAAGVDGYSMPLASDPTNVRNQWDLPDLFGRVTIPGAHVSDSSIYGFYDHDDDADIFYSPLQPVDAYSQDDFDDDNEYSGYEPFWNSRSRTRSLMPLSASPPSPLSAGSVWRQNNKNFGKNTNSFISSRGSRNRSFSRIGPALSMANYMQNGGPSNGSNGNNYNRDDYNRNNYNSNNNNNNNNREYNSYNRDNYDYDDRSRNNRGRRSSNNDSYGTSRGSQPRGTNRFNTVGSIGSVNGSNVSRNGRSMQFQNRRDSNTAGRSGRMMDDTYSPFAPDSTTRFESRRPNDAYARGGYRQDPKTGHWTDPNSNYNINESPRPTYSSDNRYTSDNSYSSDNRYSSDNSYSSSSSSFSNGARVSAPTGYERGRYGAGGNVPYDNAFYNNNNYENQDYYYDNDEDSDFYSRNGNIMDNRRGSRGNRGRSPGMDQNYYNIDSRDSNRRMDRGGGVMRYRPNNQRPDGGYYGNGYDYEVGGYDDFYDSSGSFYNSEGKRVRRFDPYSDRPNSYYNPDHLSNDHTDPDRMLQNQRRRDGRDVQNGASLRRYDPEWDSQQGLYDEASLYGSDTKGTRSYTYGYGDSMDNRVVARSRRRGDTEDPSLLGGGWGETGGRHRYMDSPNQLGDYQEGDYIEDGYDRGQARFNRQGDRYRRDSGRDSYDDDNYSSDDSGRRRRARRGLGRRDMDGERDYYRSGDYRGPDLRGDDTMERFRQGKDVKKSDPYGFETANTPSNKKRIRRRKNNRMKPRDDMREGRTVNGSYNRGRRDGGGRINGSAGRDRGMSLDDLNEML
eukprot:CAMPEP_0116118492 /NCGR_PEP_ID=MMETSP0329-20121206/2131_1 /TAXON_ID=697910 /ORGANISM="Pseudo-nitzschia arenysensis, Strain B593" /LENGTH=799 /DNA_ID=CAMNT_0003612119 /DNA_START=246 /DNA_END=2645 /DNA_ORIENTATION=-